MWLSASTNTTFGRCRRACASSITAYEIRITKSAGCTRWAAAPLMPITPLPRSPGIT
jgi:hypothetical protein